MNNYDPSYGMRLGAPTWIHAIGPILPVIIIWSIFWKGLALWHAGRRNQPSWFILVLILNTVGILEIIYLLRY